jgi:hypothetical protein
MPDKVDLFLRIHPVGGEDLPVVSRDFSSEGEALEVIAHALDAGRCLVLSQARYDRDDGETGLVVNLANVVTVRVSTKGGEAAGQYL